MKFKSVAISGDGETFAVPANEGLGVATEQITAAATLDASQVGKTLVLNAAVGKALVLPAVKTGLKYRFVVGANFATTNWTITAASKVIQGTVVVNGASILGANEDIISFVASAEQPGDWAEIECDGTNWYVSGVGSGAGSITLTAS